MGVGRGLFILIAGLMCASLVSASTSLNASPGSVSLSGKAGQSLAQCGAGCTSTTSVIGENSVSNTIQLVSLNFSAAASSSGGWLSVSPNQGTTSATLTINANPGALSAGTYSGTITLTCSSCTSTTTTVSVSFTVGAAPPLPSLLVDGSATEQISFFANAGQNSCSGCSQQVDVTASDGSALSFSAVAVSSPGNWLSVTPGQNTTEAFITISASPAGLPAGNYSGTVTLSCDLGSSCKGATISVSFNVSGVVLTATPNSFNVTLSAGQSTTEQVTLTGSANVSVAQASGTGFLQFPSSVVSPGSLTLTVNASALAAGSYSESLQLQCVNGSPCVPVTISVSLTVQAAQNLSAGALSNALSGNAGQTIMQCGATCTATFKLSASTGSLNYQITASSSGNWLGASPTSGTVTATGTSITVTANPSSLSAGSYQGTLTITCTGTTACPQIQVTVSFTVNAVPTLTGAPASISFSAGSGQSAATCSSGNCSFTVQASSGTLNFSAAPSTTSGGSWLMVSPMQATTSAGLTVTASAASLQVGNYSGTITLACNMGSTCASLTINVSISVSGVDLIATPPSSLSVTTGQTTTANVTLSTMNTGTATANVSVTSGGAFLQAPASVQAPGTLAVTIKATGLTPGPYSGTLQLQCTGSPCIAVTITVSFTVTTAPALSAGALSNLLSATAGQTQAQCGAGCTATFTLSASSGSLTFQIAASSSGNWLGASPMTGTATTSGTAVMVTANPAGLSANTYMGALTISCTGSSSCSTIQVPVTFTVNAAAPTVTIAPNPSSVSFMAVAGRGNPPAKTVTISASDGSAQAFTVSGAPAWLGVSPASGTTAQASGTLTLTPNAAIAPQPSGSATVTVTPSNGSPASTIGVSISFTPFSVSATPSMLTIGVQAGATQTQTLSIGTVDGGSATVTLAASGAAAVSVPTGQVTVPGNVTVNVNGAGLQAGSNPTAMITITCTSANPCTALTVPVQLNVTAGPAPSIKPNGIVPLNSTSTTVEQGEWIVIYGDNLANGTYNWNGDFPQTLGGTSVTIDGKPAYLYFANSTQINAQVPNDAATGTVPVVVSTPSGSITSTATLGAFGPSFCLLDGSHVAGVILRPDGSGGYGSGSGSYDIIGPTGTSLGYRTVAAKAGDSVVLYGVGFGPTNPVPPAGMPVSGAPATLNEVTMLINNASVTLGYSGLSYYWLYQFNLTLPAGLGTGDVPLEAIVGGMQTPSGVVISLQ